MDTSSARYVALEGAEACGKSTQAARLAAELDAVLTRETGGTAIGRRIREILHDTAVTDLAHHAEALLAAADRAQHLEQVVLPALHTGTHVVSDRSVYSTLAYQGFGRGLPVEQLRTINDWAIRSRWPDLVVLIDVPNEVLQQRMHGRELDRFEQAGDAFHERVRDGFHTMADDEPERFVVIDGSAGLDDVTVAVRHAVRERLGI